MFLTTLIDNRLMNGIYSFHTKSHSKKSHHGCILLRFTVLSVYVHFHSEKHDGTFDLFYVFYRPFANYFIFPSIHSR